MHPVGAAERGQRQVATQESIGRGRSASRGSRILAHNLSAPRALSRGRSEHAGQRRIRRYLNDHLIFAYGNIWQGLSEQEIADRLDHMLIATPSSSTIGQLLSGDPVSRDAFRRGELRVTGSWKAPASRGITVAGLFASMYQRIDIRLRPMLLREVRRSLESSPAVGDLPATVKDREEMKEADVPADALEDASRRPFVLDAEVLLLHLIDGSLASLLAEADSARAHDGEADALKDGKTTPPTPLPWLAGAEWRYSCCGPARSHTVTASDVESDPDGPPVGTAVIVVPLFSAFLRMLVHAVAAFYGASADSVPMGRCEHRWPGALGQVPPPKGSSNEAEPRALRLWLDPVQSTWGADERKAIRAVRRQLAEAWGGNAAPGEGLEASGSLHSVASGDAARDALVPLLHVHVRSMGGAAAASGRSKGKFSYGKQYTARAHGQHGVPPVEMAVVEG